MDYADYPPFVIKDIARVRRRINVSGLPQKITDSNLLVATWNIRAFGSIYNSWGENSDSPKRNWHALACIAEIIKRMDVVAVQEVKSDTSGLRFMIDNFLGPHWRVILSDVTAGAGGNYERLAFLFDERRVRPSGLAGEVVLPQTQMGDPQKQFDRTPYLVGFEAGGMHFSLLTAHIKYGSSPEEREPEIKALAQFITNEIRARSNTPASEEKNLIVLGDFNFDKRGDNPLFQAFVSGGLMVPEQLLDIPTTYGSEAKYYDQIGWFMDENFELSYMSRAGNVDFTGAIFKDITLLQMSFRISDHFPLWVEFSTDNSAVRMASALGVGEAQLASPDPLSSIPD